VSKLRHISIAVPVKLLASVISWSARRSRAFALCRCRKSRCRDKGISHVLALFESDSAGGRVGGSPVIIAFDCQQHHILRRHRNHAALVISIEMTGGQCRWSIPRTTPAGYSPPVCACSYATSCQWRHVPRSARHCTESGLLNALPPDVS
jgi:hypothetical protein